MLINQPIAANEIVSIKLISGDEIIAKFVSEEETTYTLSKPMALVNNGQSMMLAPFVMTADKVDIIPFLKTAMIVPPVKSQQRVKASYIEFTTGIKTTAGNESLPPLTV